MKQKKKATRIHKHVYYVVNSEEIGDKFENSKPVEIHKRGVVFLCGFPTCKRRKQKAFFVDSELNERLDRKISGKHEVILQEVFMKLVNGEVEEVKEDVADVPQRS